MQPHIVCGQKYIKRLGYYMEYEILHNGRLRFSKVKYSYYAFT